MYTSHFSTCLVDHIWIYFSLLIFLNLLFCLLWKTIKSIKNCAELQITWPTTKKWQIKCACGFTSISTNHALHECVAVLDGYHLQTITPLKKEVHNVQSYFLSHYQTYGANIQAAFLGVECELKVSTSLSTPLHSSQIIDLPPHIKKIVFYTSIIFAVMLLCVWLSNTFILYCIHISPIFPFDMQVVHDFFDCWWFIIVLPPPKKRLYYTLIIFAVMLLCIWLCVWLSNTFILYCIRISPIFPLDMQVVDKFFDCIYCLWCTSDCLCSNVAMCLIVCLIVKCDSLFYCICISPIFQFRHSGGGRFLWFLSQGLCCHIVWYFLHDDWRWYWMGGWRWRCSSYNGDDGTYHQLHCNEWAHLTRENKDRRRKKRMRSSIYNFQAKNVHSSNPTVAVRSIFQAAAYRFSPTEIENLIQCIGPHVVVSTNGEKQHQMVSFLWRPNSLYQFGSLQVVVLMISFHCLGLDTLHFSDAIWAIVQAINESTRHENRLSHRTLQTTANCAWFHAKKHSSV